LSEQELLEVLVPYKNASVFDISPSYISEQIKGRISESDRILLSGFMLCPAWLKKTDYNELAKAGKYKTLSFEQVGISDYENFFLSLGATKPSLPKVLDLLSEARLSSSSVVSFWRHLLFEDIRVTASFKVIDKKLTSAANIFICTDGIARSGSEVSRNSEYELDIIFMASLFDMAGRSTDAADLCVHCSMAISKIPVSLLETIRPSLTKSSSLVHSEMLRAISPINENVKKNGDSISNTGNNDHGLRLAVGERKRIQGKMSEPSWRDVERLAGAILLELGYDAKDVSKKNVGYDYAAYDKDNIMYCVEVKKIEAPGDDFILTDNEIYVAKDLGPRYWVLIVVQPVPSQAPTCYSIIKDFYRTFERHMARRCVKYQMFCSEYDADFSSLTFD
jgi:hypothetical protein